MALFAFGPAGAGRLGITPGLERSPHAPGFGIRRRMAPATGVAPTGGRGPEPLSAQIRTGRADGGGAASVLHADLSCCAVRVAETLNAGAGLVTDLLCEAVIARAAPAADARQLLTSNPALPVERGYAEWALGIPTVAVADTLLTRVGLQVAALVCRTVLTCAAVRTEVVEAEGGLRILAGAVGIGAAGEAHQSKSRTVDADIGLAVRILPARLWHPAFAHVATAAAAVSVGLPEVLHAIVAVVDTDAVAAGLLAAAASSTTAGLER